MGKAVFRDTSVNGVDAASEAKITGRIRVRKTRSNLKLNLLLLLQIMNLAFTGYLMYQLLGRHF